MWSVLLLELDLFANWLSLNGFWVSANGVFRSKEGFSKAFMSTEEDESLSPASRFHNRLWKEHNFFNNDCERENLQERHINELNENRNFDSSDMSSRNYHYQNSRPNQKLQIDFFLTEKGVEQEY